MVSILCRLRYLLYETRILSVIISPSTDARPKASIKEQYDSSLLSPSPNNIFSQGNYNPPSISLFFYSFLFSQKRTFSSLFLKNTVHHKFPFFSAFTITQSPQKGAYAHMGIIKAQRDGRSSDGKNIQHSRRAICLSVLAVNNILRVPQNFIWNLS